MRVDVLHSRVSLQMSEDKVKVIRECAYKFSMKLTYPHRLMLRNSAASSTACIVRMSDSQTSNTRRSRTTSVSSANSATKLVDAAFASASAIGYRGSSLVSLNEVGTYLKRCANFQEALENCDKLLIESAASQ